MSATSSTVTPSTAPSTAQSAAPSTAQLNLAYGTGRLPNGSMIDGVYRIEGVLGSGGFSTVYLATHTRLARQVAIKVLRPQWGEDGEDTAVALERFMREARTAAQLQHPNAVTVYDMGFVGELPYIAMEVFEGKSLGETLATEGPLKPAQALPMFCDALSALAEAHSLGIVHRDLKPDNLIVTKKHRRQTLEIIDFGVARLNSNDAALTQQNAFVGTLPYLPPEYIVNNVVDTSLDVYQMALTLVEALTGKMVVEGKNQLHMMHVIIEGNLDLPEGLMQGPLGPVLERALAPHGERYADASAFLEALEAIDPASVSLEVSDEAIDARASAQPTKIFNTCHAANLPALNKAPVTRTTTRPTRKKNHLAVALLLTMAALVLSTAGAFAAYLAVGP